MHTMPEEVESTTPDPIPQPETPANNPPAPEPAPPEPPAGTLPEPAPKEPEKAPDTKPEKSNDKPGVDISKLEQKNRESRAPRGDRNARPDFRGPKLEAPARTDRPEGGRGPGGDRGPRPEGNRGPRPEGGGRGPGSGPGGDRGPRREGGGDRRDDRRGPPEGIELEKLIADSLYLDNQAHNVVVRLGLMDSGTKSQLRRLYNAVRRATRAPETERQHEFVMLRARLAYTIARHSLRSLDTIERLLLQVTRKNDAKGYERFRDLFEAIVAYNE
jgi:CRISPR type III-A-associated protein Csm2